MTPEAKTLAAIVRFLKTLDHCWFLKTHGGPLQRAGVPDLLVCYRGQFVAMEVKAAGKLATSLQKHTLGQIASAWGKAAVVRSVEQVAEILDEVAGFK